MKKIDMLKIDLDDHINRRKELIDDKPTKANQFLKQNNINFKALISSYDRIIDDLKKEIKQLTKKK